MIYEVYIQIKRTGRTHAHVPTLPGCNWVTNSPEEAWSRAIPMIASHIDWLHAHGQPAPPHEEPVEPLEQRRKSVAREGHLIGFFECERQPVSPDEIPGFLALMRCARADLLALVYGLPDEILGWQPTPDSWSIQEVLRHVASAERWYLTRNLDPATISVFKPAKSIWDRLEAVHSLALERLAGLSEAVCTAIVADEAGELWSARKVFRRYVEHEREHTFHIQQILSLFREKNPFSQIPS